MQFDIGSMVIGAAIVLLFYFLYFSLSMLYNIIFPYIIYQPINLHKRAGGKWAVVTGSTDGIGKAYAFELARKGFNIILVSRTQSKLNRTKEEIKGEFEKIDVEAYSFDFSTGSSIDYKSLVEFLEGKDIGILINNVGGMANSPKILHECDGGPTHLNNEININILPTTILCAAILSQMATRRSGIIVNVSSAAAHWVYNNWTIYSASKKYVAWLTKCLQKEYEPYGITIQCLYPMLVATKMSKIESASFFGPNAESFVKQAIRTIGLVKETTGCISHQIQFEGTKITPTFVMNYLLDQKTKELQEKAKEKWAK